MNTLKSKMQSRRNVTSLTQSPQEAIAAQQAAQSSSPTEDEQKLIEKMEHSSTRALIFLSVAWFFLTVGVFTVNPVGPVGIISLCHHHYCLLYSL